MIHTFAICAYKESPYLECCIKSLIAQSQPSKIIICTSTDNEHIRSLARKYGLRLFVRKGEPDIADDWNFAYTKARTRLVTIAHQDDIYLKDYTKELIRAKRRYRDMSVFMSSSISLINDRRIEYNTVNIVKKLLRLPLRLSFLNHLSFVKRLSISFGNPIICPSLCFDKKLCGEKIFVSGYKFVLDWMTMLRLADKTGRWICVEKPLVLYRIHEDSTTKLCISSSKRPKEEKEVFDRLLPKLLSGIVQKLYRRSYEVYE